MKRKILAVSLLLAVLFTAGLFLAGCAPKPPAATPGGDTPAPAPAPTPSVYRLNIASGWVTGVYYPLAGAMSRIAYQHMDNISITVESSGASVANCKLVGSGDADMGIVQNDIAYYAYNGVVRDDFIAKPIKNIRGLFMLYPEPVQLIASKDSGIKSPADLKGKRVAVGPLGSGTEVNALHVSEAYGLTFNDFAQVERLEAGEAADFLKDGRIDAAFFTVGKGAAVIADLALVKDVLVVPIDDEHAAKLIAKYPFYAKIQLEAGTYRGLPETQTVAVVSMLICREDLPESVMYDFVKGVFNNIETIHNAHATAGKMVTLETALDGMPIELHPGALKFFKEVGMIK